MSTTPRPILSIGHNNVGRPVDLAPAARRPDGTIFPAQSYEGRSSCSPFAPDADETVERFVHDLGRYGAVIVTDNRTPSTYRESNRVTGREGHSDVDWCESRFLEGSMAAYYENGGHDGTQRNIPTTRRHAWER